MNFLSPIGHSHTSIIVYRITRTDRGRNKDGTVHPFCTREGCGPLTGVQLLLARWRENGDEGKRWVVVMSVRRVTVIVLIFTEKNRFNSILVRRSNNLTAHHLFSFLGRRQRHRRRRRRSCKNEDDENQHGHHHRA